MADAKIMALGGLFSATTVIPDDKAAAVEIEGLDGKDYIKINTTDGEESVELCGSGTGTVVANNAIVVQKADHTAEFRVQNSGSIRSNGMGLVGDDDILKLFADDDAQGSGSAIEFHVDGERHPRSWQNSYS